MTKELNKKLLDSVKYGNFEEVKKFLEAGADVNFRDKNNHTALLIASDEGNAGCQRCYGRLTVASL